MDNSNLAKRMKQYESVSKSTLIRRMPGSTGLTVEVFIHLQKGLKDHSMMY